MQYVERFHDQKYVYILAEYIRGIELSEIIYREEIGFIFEFWRSFNVLRGWISDRRMSILHSMLTDRYLVPT